MKKYFIGVLLVMAGFIIAFPVFLMTNFAMLQTSTPEFCSSCHEIEPAYREWKTSSHAHNKRGVVAVCMDCHLPPPEKTIKFLYGKTYHGLKDVVGHFLGGEYDRLETRRAATQGMENSNCLSCHQNLLYITNRRGGMLAHRSVLYPRPGYEKRCTECHENLVHNPAPLYQFATY